MPDLLSDDAIEKTMVQRLQHLYGYDVLDYHTCDSADVQDGSGRDPWGSTLVSCI